MFSTADCTLCKDPINCYNYLSMRIWLKYLLGILLGTAFAVFFPAGSKGAQEVLDFLVELVIRFGRYPLIPLLFFSIATACYTLRENKIMLKTGFWTFASIIVSTAMLTVLGLAAALLANLPRIPMTVESASNIPSIDAKNLLLQLFPYSSINSLLNDSYLLPCFILAGFIGAGANDDKTASNAAIKLFNSLSRVCYIVMGFFTEILAVALIALSCRWMLDFFALHKEGLYTPLLTLLSILLAVTALVIYPLILRLLCHERHPFRVIYASIAPFLLAFFSGDTNMTLPLSIRHGKESLGIQHRVNGVSFPLFSIFARGGSALVASVCFIVIFYSYSMLKITPGSVIKIGLTAFFFSFLLGEHSCGGTYLLLTIICTKFGGGYEAGYLLLRNAAPLLGCFAAVFDVLTAMTGSYIVGIKTSCVERQELRKFI